MKHTQRINLIRREWPRPVKAGDKPTIVRVSAMVELELDLDKIAYELGGRAVYSKRHRSQFMRGYIVGKVHNVEETRSES